MSECDERLLRLTKGWWEENTHRTEDGKAVLIEGWIDPAITWNELEPVSRLKKAMRTKTWQPYKKRYCLVCGERLLGRKRKYCSKCWPNHWKSYQAEWNKKRKEEVEG